MKTFDTIRATTEWRNDLPLAEQARRGIREIQKRVANPNMAEDVRRLALLQLRRWRGILLRAGGVK